MSAGSVSEVVEYLAWIIEGNDLDEDILEVLLEEQLDPIEAAKVAGKSLATQLKALVRAYPTPEDAREEIFRFLAEDLGEEGTCEECHAPILECNAEGTCPEARGW